MSTFKFANQIFVIRHPGWPNRDIARLLRITEDASDEEIINTHTKAALAMIDMCDAGHIRFRSAISTLLEEEPDAMALLTDLVCWLLRQCIRPPSPQEIQDARTPKGGWTRETLASWGVPWPPPKGWRAELERRYAERIDGRSHGSSSSSGMHQ